MNTGKLNLKNVIFINNLDLEAFIILFIIILILLPETLKKIAKETSILKKIISTNIFIKNKVFSLIFNI